jgi:hypothetical protein
MAQVLPFPLESETLVHGKSSPRSCNPTSRTRHQFYQLIRYNDIHNCISSVVFFLFPSKNRNRTHLLFADIVPPQLGLNSPSSKYKYSISLPFSVGVLGKKLAVPFRLPLGNVSNFELIFLSRCHIPCSALNTARATNFPCEAEEEKIRSMISRDNLASCCDEEEAEDGR